MKYLNCQLDPYPINYTVKRNFAKHKYSRNTLYTMVMDLKSSLN